MLCVCFFLPRESSFHLVKLFSVKLQSSIIHENFSKLDLSSGAHMGNQMLPSILAASSLCLKNVCSSFSTVWNYSHGWAVKRHSGKECHLDSTQCPLICHESAAQCRHNSQKCRFFCVADYKLSLLMLLFMLRNNLVLFTLDIDLLTFPLHLVYQSSRLWANSVFV